MEGNNKNGRPVRIGITHGDVNGIGYEVIIKTLAESRVNDFFTSVVYGSPKVVSYYKKVLSYPDFNFNLIKSADQAVNNKPNMVTVYHQEIKVDIGQSTQVAGEVALMALEAATADLKFGSIDALVTAPINKNNIQSSKFSFPGHTEYLAQKFSTNEVIMLMVNNNLRVGVATGHVPISKVAGLLTKELLLKKIGQMNQSLIRDFGKGKPLIAVLGLNPHAGDNGLLGTEENEVIIPAVEQAFNEGILALGPFAADGFFGSEAFTKFDGVLAMYHDQGLIPFKALSSPGGVNFTAGLPYVRTSPAHGTAYDLAGKGTANPQSMRDALFLAVEIVKNRQLHDQLTADPLYGKIQSSYHEKDDSIDDLPETDE